MSDHTNNDIVPSSDFIEVQTPSDGEVYFLLNWAISGNSIDTIQDEDQIEHYFDHNENTPTELADFVEGLESMRFLKEGLAMGLGKKYKLPSKMDVESILVGEDIHEVFAAIDYPYSHYFQAKKAYSILKSGKLNALLKLNTKGEELVEFFENNEDEIKKGIIETIDKVQSITEVAFKNLKKNIESGSLPEGQEP